tara:strand:- start:149 stop:556 length:408 start_codon:yes stop_codon:yes gene_type:complete
MSLFNKGFSMLPTRSLFNKLGQSGRSLFNKGVGAARQFSSGLGQASKLLGDVSREGDKVLNNPDVKTLARQVGAGGFLGGLSGLTGGAASGSALLGKASLATNPATYAGQSPARAVSSALERAKSLGSQSKNMFM